MTVTPDDVRRIARLARLAAPEARLEELAGELNGILTWIDQLNEVDVEGVEAMSSAVDVSLPLRDDAVTDGDRAQDVLANAPRAEAGFFVVPKVVE